MLSEVPTMRGIAPPMNLEAVLALQWVGVGPQMRILLWLPIGRWSRRNRGSVGTRAREW
jgi:hypothetical protein